MFRDLMNALPGLNAPPGNEEVSIGLEALENAFREIYPDQLDVTTMRTLIPYSLGGPDPLDSVHMYNNQGNPELGVPPHWHCISLGFSDLHGDSRIHMRTGPGFPSGFGFELTFRVVKRDGENDPPRWPAALMQSLARYVFNCGNIFKPGDHIPWHAPLGQGSGRVSQLLMAKDPQLPDVLSTPLGDVNFVQIIGITPEELKAVQQWNAAGVTELLKSIPECGPWLVTDTNRQHSIMEVDPTADEKIRTGIERDGSKLGAVSAVCSWVLMNDADPGDKYREAKTGDDDDDEGPKPDTSVKTEQKLPSESQEASSSKEADSPLKILPGIHLTFNLEAGSLLPLVIKGRIKHGRLFTFNPVDNAAITFVPPSITDKFVTLATPYVAKGTWLHVMISDALAEKMVDEFQIFDAPGEIPLPKTFTWPEYKLKITIISN